MSPSKLSLVLALPFLFTSHFAFADASEEPLPQLSQEPEAPVPVPVPTPALSPPPALAPARSPTSPPTVAAPPPAPSPWQASLGLRMTYVGSEGFDPFASNDALPQLAIGAGRTVFEQDRLSLATIGSFNVGGRSGTARGETTSLTVMSFTLGPEARYHLGRWAFVHFRPSFAVSRTLARIDETSSNATLHARDWLFGFDVVAGGAVSFGKVAKESDVRAWLVAEGGYAWSNQTSLAFRPDDGDSDAPLRASPLNLGELALRGPMFRVAAALSF